MAGRPRLRIGQHGKVSRRYLGGGVWEASCRFRDTDGVTRKIQRLGPADEFDKHGKLAEDLLMEALAERRTPTAGDITLDTPVMSLVDLHLARKAEDGRASTTLELYARVARQLRVFLGGVRVGEASVPRLDAALRAMQAAHCVETARVGKVVLSGGLQLAVMANVLSGNPVRDVPPLVSADKPTGRKGAPALSAEQLRTLLATVRTSDFCAQYDLADPVTLLAATGLRISELFGLRWVDVDMEAGRLSVTGKVVRVKGEGMTRKPEPKSAAGLRTVPLPPFALDMLTARRKVDFYGQQEMVFPSTAGTWRDPTTYSAKWNEVRAELGVPEVSSHSFRKTVADLIDAGGLSARVGADQLGHSHVSMTQDVYMSRGKVHAEVADLLERAVISAE